MSIAGSGETRPGSMRASAGALLVRLQGLLASDDHHAVAQRQAGMVFVIRVVAAGGLHIFIWPR